SLASSLPARTRPARTRVVHARRDLTEQAVGRCTRARQVERVRAWLHPIADRSPVALQYRIDAPQVRPDCDWPPPWRWPALAASVTYLSDVGHLSGGTRKIFLCRTLGLRLGSSDRCVERAAREGAQAVSGVSGVSGVGGCRPRRLRQRLVRRGSGRSSG